MAIASPTLFICVFSVGSACGKFLEGKARNLGDDVINGRLEAGRGFARDVVVDFVEQIADGEFGGDFRDRESRWPCDASAEERETRGFISMMTMRPLSGLTPNWMFEPPVSTPTARITANEASRMI